MENDLIYGQHSLTGPCAAIDPHFTRQSRRSQASAYGVQLHHILLPITSCSMAPRHPPNDFTANLKPHPSADGSAILTSERARSALSSTALSTHLFGSEYLSRQSRILSALQQDDVFNKTNQANLSRPDRYKLSLARGKRMRQLMDKHGWNNDDLLMAEYLIDEPQPYHLHMSLFAAAMRDQTSDEQKAYWQPKIDNWEVIGAYAQ